MSSTFINMDFDSDTNKYWVEYTDSDGVDQKVEYDTELEQLTAYNEIQNGTFD